MTEEPERIEQVIRKHEDLAGPKWKSLEKYTVRINQDQIDWLHRAARDIMKTRTGEKRERITANTILRTAVETFRELGLNLKDQDIPTERDLLRRSLNKLRKNTLQ